MSLWSEFIRSKLDASASLWPGDDRDDIAHFGDTAAEYAALKAGPAIAYRPERSIIEISGADRASWLHNITTNQVKTLSTGQGNYVFVCNAAGRILFDANVLVRPESIWVDVDGACADSALKHFDKYIVMEDVAVCDCTTRFVRLALVGAASPGVLEAHGLSNAGNLPLLESATVTIGDATMTLVRTDFCGPWSVELFVEVDHAPGVWTALTGDGRATPVGCEAVEICRIEAGVPRWGCEITDNTLPGETGRSDRAVSTNKGCYIGQEVIERMRSRGVVARKLVGLVVSGDGVPAAGAAVLDVDRTVGSVTSACRSIGMERPIALAYVKPQWAAFEKELRIEFEGVEVAATVCPLPLVE
ncbi:MAG: YgfZ/GcvT domain-containing protein [Phycisphaerae bacterium]